MDPLDPRYIGPVFRALTWPGRLLWRLIVYSNMSWHSGSDPDDPTYHLLYTGYALVALSFAAAMLFRVTGQR